MSSIVYKYIPMNIEETIITSQEELNVYFTKHLESYGEIRKRSYDQIEFIDCGSRFESVVCNHCYHSLLHMWGEAMDSSFRRSKFQNRELITPCCGKKTELNKLVYYGDSGFAKSVVEVIRPSNDIDDLEINQLETLFGCHFKCVIAPI